MSDDKKKRLAEIREAAQTYRMDAVWYSLNTTFLFDVIDRQAEALKAVEALCEEEPCGHDGACDCVDEEIPKKWIRAALASADHRDGGEK